MVKLYNPLDSGVFSRDKPSLGWCFRQGALLLVIPHSSSRPYTSKWCCVIWNTMILLHVNGKQGTIKCYLSKQMRRWQVSLSLLSRSIATQSCYSCVGVSMTTWRWENTFHKYLKTLRDMWYCRTSLFTCGMQLEIHTTNTKNPKPKDVLKLELSPAYLEFTFPAVFLEFGFLQEVASISHSLTHILSITKKNQVI